MAGPATFSLLFVALQKASLRLAPRWLEMLARIYPSVMSKRHILIDLTGNGSQRIAQSDLL